MDFGRPGSVKVDPTKTRLLSVWVSYLLSPVWCMGLLGRIPDAKLFLDAFKTATTTVIVKNPSQVVNQG